MQTVQIDSDARPELIKMEVPILMAPATVPPGLGMPRVGPTKVE